MAGRQMQLHDVVSVFGTPENPSSAPIARDTVRVWLANVEDVEAQGALCSYLLDEDYSSRIRRPLSFLTFIPSWLPTFSDA